jgi:hypothetical protein
MTSTTQDLNRRGDAAPMTTSSGRSWSLRRVGAATAATLLVSISIGGGPLAVAGVGVAPASAQSSVLEQSQGGAQQQQKATRPAPGGAANSEANLNPPADFSAPGVDKGSKLIGWAKAGALVFGVLGLIGGVVIGKVLKEAGNHHASGVRATSMGIGGAMVVAGAAPTIVPWLMG